jgi:hypothetical protein
MKQKTQKLPLFFMLTLLSLLLWQCNNTKREEIIILPNIDYPNISLSTDYAATTQATAIVDVTKSGQENRYSIELLYSNNADMSRSVKTLAGFGRKVFTEGESLPFRVTGLAANRDYYIRGILNLPDTVIQTDIVQFQTLEKNTLGRFSPLNDPQAGFGNNTQIAFTANQKGYIIGGDVSSETLYLWEYNSQSGVWSRKEANQDATLSGLFFSNNLNQTFALNGQYYMASPTSTGWRFYTLNLGTGRIEDYATIQASGSKIAVANNQLFIVGLSPIAGNTSNKQLEVTQIDLSSKSVVKTTSATTANYDNVVMAQAVQDEIQIVLGNLANDTQELRQFNPAASTIGNAISLSGKLPKTDILSTFEANGKIYYFSRPASSDNSSHYLSVFNPSGLAHTRLSEYGGNISSNAFRINNIFYIVHSNSNSYVLEVDL